MFRINNTYFTFISHSWTYSNDYNTVLNWLMESNINIRDYSVPITEPFDPMKKSLLQEKITEQIRHASVVIILSGMYAAHSGWIDYEIDEAIRMDKPILGVRPWGQERVPTKISNNANLMVGWNRASVVDAFKSLV